MTQINWKNNDHSGAFVERSLRQLETLFEKQKSPAKKLAILQKYVWIWSVKANIAKSDKEKELEERIKKLEELAGLAQKQVISP